jgi:hypothetical protein
LFKCVKIIINKKEKWGGQEKSIENKIKWGQNKMGTK